MLHRKSACELRRMIASKQVSPSELIQHTRNRIERINPTINAVVTTDWDRAFLVAKKLDELVMRGESLGILHGLPVAVKDLTLTKGLRTTFGSTFFSDFVPEEDEARIASVRSHGAIIVGKTNTPEFGAGANTFNDVFGPTRNPHDVRLSVAGSSGGSAAALAADLVPLATGSDMGGSLRTPASFCGVVGFRPTPGVVPAEHNRLAWSPLMVEGPMARNVRDVALLLAGMSCRCDADPFSRPIQPGPLLDLHVADLSSLKVAFSEDLGFAQVAKGERDSFRSKMERIEKHFGYVAWDQPDVGDADGIFETLRAVHFVESFSSYNPNEIKKLSRNIQQNMIEAERISINDVAKAYGEQTKSWRRAQTFFSKYDVLISPAAAVPPFPVEQIYPDKIDNVKMRNYIQWFALGFGISIIAHPAVCIPCGRGSTGMPFGIQVVGRFRDDLGALSIAYALEELFAGHEELKRPMPDIQ